jgi:hypothetical protein
MEESLIRCQFSTTTLCMNKMDPITWHSSKSHSAQINQLVLNYESVCGSALFSYQIRKIWFAWLTIWIWYLTKVHDCLNSKIWHFEIKFQLLISVLRILIIQSLMNTWRISTTIQCSN